MPRRQYRRLPDHETPALLLRSLVEEALLLLASPSKAISPLQILPRTMDPPQLDTVHSALDFLVSLGAASKDASGGGKNRNMNRNRNKRGAKQGGYCCTSFGRLLDSMPVSMTAARLAVAGAAMGLLREGESHQT
jgi:hypothetical protein